MIGNALFRALTILKRFLSLKRASISVIIAVSSIPIATGLALSLEYGRYLWVKAKFDEVADASALYAVSKPMLTQSQAMVSLRAKKFFDDQIRNFTSLQGILNEASTVNVTSSANGMRIVDIHYQATIPTLFFSLFGINTFSIYGDREAENGLSPNIDFHILLDTSPSMAFPTTQEGLDIISNSNSSRCLFACHSVQDVRGVKRDGSMGDLYSVARSYNLPLRLDAEAEAVSDLASLARQASAENKTHYRMSVFEFNLAENFKNLVELTNDYSKVPSAVHGLEPPLYWKDNCYTEACGSSDPGDRATASTHALEKMNNYIQDPGSGQKDGAPQAVLLIITDGMRDELRSQDPSFPDYEFQASACDAIKKRGIRIGILYTVYSEESVMDGGWSQTYILPNLYRVEPALKACASDALFIPVKTGENISSALEKLFQATITAARLTK